MTKEIDNDFLPEKEYPFRETLRWWERKRIRYNLSILAVQSIVIFEYWKYVAHELKELIITSIFFLFAANISYCLGWGIEFLISYYWKIKQPLQSLRVTLFVLGMLFSLITTLAFWEQFFWLRTIFLF